MNSRTTRRADDIVGEIILSLESTFETKFNMWMQSVESPNSPWVCLSGDATCITPEHMLDDGRSAADFFRTSLKSGPRPSVLKLAEHEFLICVPLNRNARTPMLAVTVMKARETELVQKMSEMWVDTLQYLMEERHLNATYGFEISESMGATGMLQSLASQLRTCRDVDSWVELTRRTLADLCFGLRAETVIFVPAAGLQEHLDIMSDGKHELTDLQCQRIIAMSSPCSSQPLVLNNATMDLQRHNIFGIKSLVLVEIFPPESIGWLIALNKSPNFPAGLRVADTNHFEFGTPEAGLMTTVGSLLGVVIRHCLENTMATASGRGVLEQLDGVR